MEQLPLRDIHLPDAMSGWPPALGWWLLILLCMLLIGLIFMIRRWYLSPKRVALRELSHLKKLKKELKPQILIQHISTLLRRVCMTLYPRADVASLSGETWLQFLDQLSGKQQFTQGIGRCLMDAPYRQHIEVMDMDALLNLCRSVINRG